PSHLSVLPTCSRRLLQGRARVPGEKTTASKLLPAQHPSCGPKQPLASNAAKMYDPARDIFKPGESEEPRPEDSQQHESKGSNHRSGRAAKEPNGGLQYGDAPAGQPEASGNSHRSFAGKEQSSPGQPDSRRRGR